MEAARLSRAAGMRGAAWVLGGLLALRLSLAATLELMPQEAYYFFYAEHPALSYFDHPPVLAWSLWLTSQLFGKSVFTLRATSFLFTALTLWSFVLLARRFLPEPARARGVLLLFVTGMVTVLGLISTPDVPLLLFWSLALIQLSRAILDGNRPAWLLAGLCMGLAFDSKYTGVLLQGGMLLFLVLSAPHRRWLRTPWPWAALFLAQLASVPVYAWNAAHGFASLLFQSSERAQGVGHSIRPEFFLGLLVTQAALLTPPLLGALILCALRGLRGARALLQSPQTLFLACFFLPGFLLFTGLSLMMLVKPNWLLPTYLTGLLWLSLTAGPRLLRWTVGSAVVLHVLAAIQLWAYPVPIRSDDTWIGWEQLAAEVDRRWAEEPDLFVFSADDYKTSAQLSFYLDRTVYGRNVLGRRGLQYDYVGWDLDALRGRSALYVDSQPRHAGRIDAPAEEPPGGLLDHFAAAEELEPIHLTHRGRVVRAFRVWRAEDYRGPSGRPAPPPGPDVATH